ncbi:ComF family protein [Pseudomonas guariconensis]|uniref:ComF family protein n=1 Tax=Pseudomonas TaxID=286 RepID=UPI00209824B3|nr:MULTISPECIES: ComF family protein [Pseudomonas]MCO7514191.1 ComF family protein [Pseudomonas putida]MCO7593648.1 ComF family protein [Pseudomonas guariconensis]MCO7607309.1 ComF family protein [Pseudomonas guariconensis]MCU7219278.1 ComF family protein [Pseudomonas brassicacearum]
MDCQPPLKTLVYKCTNINQYCLLCDEPAAQAYPLCMACELELPWLDEHCTRCALPLPMDDLTCGQCSRRPPAFEQAVAAWHYGFPVDTLIARFKHHSQWPLGRLMAQLLGHALQHRFAQGLPRPDQLLPVPLGMRRLRQRGFNQAGMLARWLSTQLAIPSDDQLLRRVRETPAQQTLDAKARQRNLRQAFTLAPDAAVEGQHLALVDDVLTTGATVQALASLLRKAGARRVDVYCLARTPKPGQA